MLAIATLGLGSLLAAGMLRRRADAAQSPPAAMLAVERLELDGKAIRLANLLGADDACEAAALAERLLAAGLIRPPVVAIVNCRPDRVVRNKQTARILPRLGADKAFVIGHPSRSAIVEIPDDWTGAVVDLGGHRSLDELVRTILDEVGSDASLVAVGSFHGPGELLLEHLRAIGTVGG